MSLESEEILKIDATFFTLLGLNLTDKKVSSIWRQRRGPDIRTGTPVQSSACSVKVPGLPRNDPMAQRANSSIQNLSRVIPERCSPSVKGAAPLETQIALYGASLTKETCVSHPPKTPATRSGGGGGGGGDTNVIWSQGRSAGPRHQWDAIIRIRNCDVK